MGPILPYSTHHFPLSLPPSSFSLPITTFLFFTLLIIRLTIGCTEIWNSRNDLWKVFYFSVKFLCLYILLWGVFLFDIFDTLFYVTKLINSMMYICVLFLFLFWTSKAMLWSLVRYYSLLKSLDIVRERVIVKERTSFGRVSQPIKG